MTQQRRSQWAVVVINATVVVAVIALVAVLALVVRPPAPPGIAAFAPQASKAITKAPQEQTSQNGDGTTGCKDGGTTCEGVSPTPTPSAASPTPSKALLTTGVPSSLQCYKWPDGTVTQTFDPQSPPCIAGWDDKKGNGGATSPGVTATEIRIAYPADAKLPQFPSNQMLVDFVNSRFQLYGRKIRIVPYTSKAAQGQSLGTDVNNPASQRADAAQVTQLKVFGAFDFIDPIAYAWALPSYRDIVTKAKIVSIMGSGSPPFATEADLIKKAPYEWSYMPPFDSLMSNVGTMICRQLVGKPASHANDKKIAQQTRKFAVLIPDDETLGGPALGLSTLLGIIKGCGVDSPKIVRFNSKNANSTSNATSFQQLKQDGVTSMIFFPWAGSAQNGSPLNSANRIGWYPEWVTIGWNHYFTDVQTSSNAPKEKAGVFGIGGWNKQSEISQEIWFQACTAGGGTADSCTNLLNGREFYQELLLLASGIQQAGPNLTPQTFATGLHSTDFPNPGAGSPRIYQATVGFPSDSPAMIRDYAAWWFSSDAVNENLVNAKDNRAVNTYRGQCFIGQGRRWTLDTWPTKDEYYQGPCR